MILLGLTAVVVVGGRRRSRQPGAVNLGICIPSAVRSGVRPASGCPSSVVYICRCPAGSVARICCYADTGPAVGGPAVG